MMPFPLRIARKPYSIAVAFLFGLAFTAPLARAATSGANGTHDPSRMIESDGKFYVYSTGGGAKSSTDGLVWANEVGIFSGGSIPTSVTSMVPANEGVWAPDVIYLNGLYYLYYAVADDPNAYNDCAIGLVTSPTLNPSASNYKWTDHGVVVFSTGSDTYCALDPSPMIDATGNLWLSWGSGYSHSTSDYTIYVTRLDNATGMASAADTTKPGYPLERGHIEGSYLYYHNDYYYLFWNSGGCCGGSGKPNSSISYEIHVARSQSVTGPYTEGALFDKGGNGIYGPGQIGIYDKCGADRFTYHYYPTTGGSVLGENEISWGSDGWPVVGSESTTPLKPCGQIGDGSSDGGVFDGSGAAAEAGSTGASGSESGSAGSPGAMPTVGAEAASMEGDEGGSNSGTGGAAPTGGDQTGAVGEPGSSGTAETATDGGPTATGAVSGSASAASGGATGPSGSSGQSSETAKNSSGGGCSYGGGGAQRSDGSPCSLLLLGAAVEAARRRRKRSRRSGGVFVA